MSESVAAPIAPLLKQSLRGIVPPMVTPLSNRDALDVPGLERLVEHLLVGGVHGLFLLGTTGEGPSLSYRLRRELIERTCRLVNGRVPVLVCVTDTSIEESLAVARHAAASGADAVVASTPYYFPAAQPELLHYFETLASELPLPLYLYNMPAMTKTSLDRETVRQLMHNPRIIGIKDSSGDLTYFERLLELAREREDWPVFIGQEELTSHAVQRGARGGINAGANLLPRLYVENYEAAAAGDVDRGERLNVEVLRVAGKIYTVGRHGSSLIKGVKCALSLLGICDDELAEPFQRFGEAERDIIRERLEELGCRLAESA